MKKTVVIYKSIYGSTKKYASWISEELNCDLFEESQITLEELKSYDNIILGGGLYASGILGASLIKNNFNLIKDKNIILFTVGLSDPTVKNQYTSLLEKNLTPEIKNSINIFHLRGAINYKKLKLKHKIMMWMLVTMVKKKNPNELSEDDKLMIETYGDIVDFINKESIKPIIDEVK